MAYIGGATHFIGPVLGAVTITWLQSSLSGYTSAWLLYLGVFFIVVILYAPAGLAGLLLMHGRVITRRGFRKLVGAYAVALVPAAIMAAGAIVVIEMSYRLATQPELGTKMRILWTAIDAATELAAYYPIQVEKTLDRCERLLSEIGPHALAAAFTEEENDVLKEFLEHGAEVRAERKRAAAANEAPDFVKLVRKWGGVSLA